MNAKTAMDMVSQNIAQWMRRTARAKKKASLVTAAGVLLDLANELHEAGGDA